MISFIDELFLAWQQFLQSVGRMIRQNRKGLAQPLEGFDIIHLTSGQQGIKHRCMLGGTM